MAELASHQLDVANWLLGVPPRRAIGSGGIDYWRDGREVFDNVSCIYEYELPVPPGLRPRPGRLRRCRRPTPSASPTPRSRTTRTRGPPSWSWGPGGRSSSPRTRGCSSASKRLDDPGWSRDGEPATDATVITSGKTLKLSNDPWAHRGKPFEIDAHGDDTRDELVAFLDCVRRATRQPSATPAAGLINAATVLIGDEAMRTGQAVTFPDDLV